MKYRTTKKAMKESYRKIYCAGNDSLQHLLKFHDPIAYSTRAEGWACDYYDINGILLSSGYAPIGKNIDYNLRSKYDDEARKILSNYDLEYEEKKKQIEILLNEFMEIVTKGGCKQ